MSKVLNFIFSLSLLTLFALNATSQNIPPAKWSVKASVNEAKIGDVVELIFTTTIPDGIHIYANDFKCDPVMAELVLDKNAAISAIGKPKATGAHRYTDDIFGCEVNEWKKKADFRQKIKVLKANPTVSGILEYQMCTDDGSCVLHEFEFKVPIKTIAGAEIAIPDVETTDPKIATQVEIPAVDNATQNPSSDDIIKNYIAKIGGDKDVDAKTKYGDVIKTTDVNYSGYKASNQSDTSTCEIKTFNGQTEETQESYWGLFFLAFLSGLAALLTPCVFPMIPMTVSFFMKEGSKAKAIRTGIIYGLSIIGIYVIIGTLVAVIAGPAAANWLSTHWLPNIFFFLIFVIFAASFFGAFEIVLPSWIVNKADQQADKGGLTGIFFMAFTIVLVSFSCTGPIVGSILVQSAGGKFVEPVVGMFGFSLAFAIPFTLFAIFPSWLNTLPKSGGWLNSVKVVLGFLELAFGLKFLSVADQTYHWGLLDREIYIGLWIVIFGLMGLYLLGKIKFSHDSELKFLKVPRLMFAIATFSFVVYLIPGLIGAPLKSLAGYLPPMSTHDYNIVQKITNPNNVTQGYGGVKPKYNEKLHLPDGLKGYFDYEQGMEVARAMGKPVFLDFTGHGCVNCREMEARVWSDHRVHQFLDEEYIIISLYVDDKELKFPEAEWFYNKQGRQIKDLAKKNSTIQQCFFGANAQPQYALLDNKGNLLQPTRTYDLNKDDYVDFLTAGVEEYKKRMDEELANK